MGGSRFPREERISFRRGPDEGDPPVRVSFDRDSRHGRIPRGPPWRQRGTSQIAPSLRLRSYGDDRFARAIHRRCEFQLSALPGVLARGPAIATLHSMPGHEPHGFWADHRRWAPAPRTTLVDRDAHRVGSLGTFQSYSSSNHTTATSVWPT